MNNTQTHIKNPVSKRLHLLRLLGVNLSLAALLCLQTGSSARTNDVHTAWLAQRTPAMTEQLHTAASKQESSAFSRMRVTLKDLSLTVPSLDSSSFDAREKMSSESSKSSKSSTSSQSSTSSESSVVPAPPSSESHTILSASSTFPSFGRAVSPVSRTPDWGAMKTPAEWNRSYNQMTTKDFVQIPAYDLRTLMTPLSLLAKTRDDPETVRMITAKLYYSTRFFGAYDLDAGEFSAVHPGIDLKLAEGTPVGSMAGGRVHDVRREEKSLGLHIIIEHRATDGQTYYSVYGHLDEAWVAKGDTVDPGTAIGTVGMTGSTSGPHLHLQIDRGDPDETYHSVYWPSGIPSRQDADIHSVNPVVFIRQY